MKRWIWMVVLLLASSVAAQPGPAPGQTPLEHTISYAQSKAASATQDPVGTVQQTATPEAVQNETHHAGYVVCWAAYDTLEQAPPGCEAFFTPPGTYTPPQEAPVVVAEDPVNETLQTVEEILPVEPPVKPTDVWRDVGHAVGSVVAWVWHVLSETIDGIGQGLNALGQATLRLAELGGQIAAAAGDALDAMLGALAAVGRGLGDGTHAVAIGLGDAANAVGQAAAVTGEAVQNAVAQAAQGVQEAAEWSAKQIKNAGDAVVAWVQEILGSPEPTRQATDALPQREGDATRQVTSLVDEVVSVVS